MRSLEDLVKYNYDNDGTEGGNPVSSSTGNPAFWSGQDDFLASLETGGAQDETYFQALSLTQTSTKRGIDHALTAHSNGKRLSGLLVPSEVGQSYQIAAQAQYPVITVPAGYHDKEGDRGMPYGLAIMQTMWGEEELVRWGSAIEDLVRSEGGSIGVGRQRPRWLAYRERNLPVPF
jgi:amidase